MTHRSRLSIALPIIAASLLFTVATGAAAASARAVRASNASLFGMADGKPRLRFTVSAPFAGVRHVVIALPRGLSFAPTKKVRKQGVTVTFPSAHYALPGLPLPGKLHRGKLQVGLGGTPTALRVKLRSPAIRETAALKRRVRHHRVGKLSIKLTVVDGSGAVSHITLRLKPRP